MPAHEAGVLAGVSTEEARHLFRHEGDGGRLVALVLAEDLRSPECFDFILDAVGEPLSAFEAWHALRAATFIAPRIHPEDRRVLLAAVRERMTPTGPGTRYDESDFDLFQFAREIVESRPAA